MKRLFVILPMRVLWFCILCTIVIPAIYWVATGDDLMMVIDAKIVKLTERINNERK